jgi:putative adhesin
MLAQADEWRKTYTTSGRPEINVDASDGDIHVNASDRKDVEAVVTANGRKIGQGGVVISDHQDGDRVTITVRIPNHWGINIGWHSRSLRVELAVPRESNVDLHSGDGNIRVMDVKGMLLLESGDGDIEARGTDGSIKAHTGDGNINITGVYADLDLRTGDGNIEAEARVGSKMNSRWSLRTGDGNLELRVPDGFSADLDAHTGDGHVSLEIPVTVEGTVKESTVRGKLNSGGQTLELRSRDGNISLLKS